MAHPLLTGRQQQRDEVPGRCSRRKEAVCEGFWTEADVELPGALVPHCCAIHPRHGTACVPCLQAQRNCNVRGRHARCVRLLYFGMLQLRVIHEPTSDDAAAVRICFDNSVLGNRLAELGPPVRGARPASEGVGTLKRYKASTQGAFAPADSCIASDCPMAADTNMTQSAATTTAFLTSMPNC